MAELQACFADRRVVHNRQKARRIRHDRSIEKCFIVIEQIVEINVAFEVGVLLAKLQHHALQLQFLGLRYVGYEANKTERLFFFFAESGGLVERWVME